MKRLYTFIIALTFYSILKITENISRYLDWGFIERQMENIFDIMFVLGAVRTLCIILIVIFLIINVINFIIKYRKNDLITLEKYAKTIKIGLIPFWILQLCFIIGSIYNNSLNIYNNDNPLFINALLNFNVLYYFVTSYFYLLYSSIFSIGYIKLLFKNNKIDKEMFNEHRTMQLFFVSDIISVIYLLRKGGTL